MFSKIIKVSLRKVLFNRLYNCCIIYLENAKKKTKTKLHITLLQRMCKSPLDCEELPAAG